MPGPALVHTRVFFGRRVVTEAGDSFGDGTEWLLIICHTAGDEVREQKKAKT